MKFVWDTEKNKLNIEKHGIGFTLAEKVFYDTNRIEYYDEKHSGIEDRYITIGYAGEVIFVVYTERNDSIRIISARLADKDEKETYYNYGKTRQKS